MKMKTQIRLQKINQVGKKLYEEQLQGSLGFLGLRSASYGQFDFLRAQSIYLLIQMGLVLRILSNQRSLWEVSFNYSEAKDLLLNINF